MIFYNTGIIGFGAEHLPPEHAGHPGGHSSFVAQGAPHFGKQLLWMLPPNPLFVTHLQYGKHFPFRAPQLIFGSELAQ
jgi:hypothetical protein